jgi:NADPH-dependent ferric siderophore reductase
MVRVVLGSRAFDTFVPSKFTDSYVKMAFVADDVDVARLPQPLTLDSFADLPSEKRPSVRTMTVRQVDVAAREITVDIVVHGEHGVAGPWAAAAQPGQPIYLMGPGGAYTPDPAADWHLLAGDESALCHFRCVGSVARQRGWQGIHRGSRPRGRDRFDRTGVR